MTRPIINFEKTKIYVSMSDIISQKTRINEAVSPGATSFHVISRNGFNQPGFCVLGELGAETAEIISVKSEIGEFGENSYGDALYGQNGDITELRNIVLNSAVEFEHENKEPVYQIEYNQARIYKNSTLIGTVALNPDYLTAFSVAVESESSYQVSYYNTLNSVESEKGLAVSGYNRLLCTAQDMRKIYSDIQATGINLIEKMDLARDEIRRVLLRQGNDFKDFENLEQLAMPAAFLSSYYVYLELSKNSEDEASLRKKESYEKFETELEAVLSTLEDEPEVNAIGSVQFLR